MFGLLGLLGNLVTGFSLWPIRLISLVGTLLALLGGGFGLYIGLQGLQDSPQTLFEKVAQAAVELFQDTFPLIKAGLAPRAPQDPTQATYFGGRTPDDGNIAWERPAIALDNLVRAVTAPYPGAFTYIRGKKLYVWSARLIQDGTGGRWPPGTILGAYNGACPITTGAGHLLLTQVQRQGEEVIAGDTWFRSAGVAGGMRLGEEQA